MRGKLTTIVINIKTVPDEIAKSEGGTGPIQSCEAEESGISPIQSCETEESGISPTQSCETEESGISPTQFLYTELATTYRIEQWNGVGDLTTFLQEKKINVSDALLLSNQEEHLLQARELGMARIGYLPPGTDEFLAGTDTVVENLSDLEPDFFEKRFERQHGIPWTIFTTARLLVRELEMNDLDDLFELYQYEGMTDYMEGLYPYEEEKKYQKAYIDCMYRYYGFGMWLVFEKESGKLVGRAGFEQRDDLDGEVELGYAIGTPFWGRGYATEVCEGILSFIEKEEFGFERVNCLIEPENVASIHVAQKLGFQFLEEVHREGKKMRRYVLDMTNRRCILQKNKI